ncbi:MAG: hypothetical protein ACP5JL_08725 [bacterium]
MRRVLSKVALILVLVLAFQALTGTFAMAAEAQQAKKMDPVIAAIASLILPGLGQYLLGDQSKGLTHLLIDIGIWVVSIVLSFVGIGLITWVLAPLWSIYSAIDAYNMASAK